ncbi:MAG: hypothetical protein ABIZ36_03170 [Gemmatimonadaceae bacterium]
MTKFDDAMPWIEATLEHGPADEMLRRAITLDGVDTKELRLVKTTLIRHRLGRRAVVEYAVELLSSDRPRTIRIVGKTRAKGLDREVVRVLTDLRAAGFGLDSPDGISVAEVVGVAPEWHMWLAIKIEGPTATDLLAGSPVHFSARRIADVATKIHRSGVASRRLHSIGDEIDVLRAALDRASDARPELASRIEAIGDGCRSIAQATERGKPGSIHRDFYSDQIVISGDRLVVLDFDLFSAGEIELDIGNFTAHVTELSARQRGHPYGLDEVRRGIVDRAVESGASRELIGVYDLLALARHVWISTRITGRNHVTETILAECERRLEAASLEQLS